MSNFPIKDCVGKILALVIETVAIAFLGVSISAVLFIPTKY